jgi:hypothetical protein
MTTTAIPICRRLESLERGPRHTFRVRWLGVEPTGAVRMGGHGGLLSSVQAHRIARQLAGLGLDSWVEIEGGIG